METVKDRIYCAKQGLIKKVNQMIKDGSTVVFHQSEKAGKIIENVEESKDLLIIDLVDADIPHEERSYVITFLGTKIRADRLEIYTDETYSVCKVVHYNDDMIEEYKDLYCRPDEYFKLSATVEEGIYEIEIMKLPPWQISINMKPEELLDLFPVVEVDDKTEINVNGEYVYTSKIYAYLNPFDIDKIFVNKVTSKLTKNLSVHNSEVRAIRDRFASIDTLSFIPGAVICLNNGTTELYKIQNISEGVAICTMISHKYDNARMNEHEYAIRLHVGTIVDNIGNIQIIRATENIFSYSKSIHEVTIIHNGHFTNDGEMIEVMDKVYGIIRVVERYDEFISNDARKMPDIIDSIKTEEDADKNKLVSKVRKLSIDIRNVIDDLNSIMGELSNGVINIYMADERVLHKFDTNIIMEIYSLISGMVTEISLKYA